MRVIVYGIGAIGGTLAARLAQTGTEVTGIARGSMLAAIRARGGLNLVSHAGRGLVAFPVVAGPEEIDWRADDCILLTMKSNDTLAALEALAAAGVDRQPVVCAQNGVANERMALRRFPNVFAMGVMMPAQFTQPGTVAAEGTPKLGILDLGRASPGGNAEVEPLAEAVRAAGFICEITPEAMAGKYGKLLLNLGNIVGAALGMPARFGPWFDRVRVEGEAVLAAAGIATVDAGMDNPRRQEMRRVALEGVEQVGSSSVQSLIRGTGSIETDYLNGEIVLLGRQLGIPTPANAAFQTVARRMLRDRMAPGSFPEAEVARLFEAG